MEPKINAFMKQAQDMRFTVPFNLTGQRPAHRFPAGAHGRACRGRSGPLQRAGDVIISP